MSSARIETTRARLRSALGRFACDERATMSVEIVLMLPLLMLWLAASFVFFDVFRVNMVNEKAAYTIADMISRQTTVDGDFIEGTNNVFDFLINRRGTTWLRVTSVKYKAADPVEGTPESYEVQWSFATRGRQAFESADFVNLELEKRIPIMSDQETIIVTETFTGYRPPFNPFRISPFDLDDESTPAVFSDSFDFNTFLVTRPRFVREIALDAST
jgi:hypothetical protein